MIGGNVASQRIEDRIEGKLDAIALSQLVRIEEKLNALAVALGGPTLVLRWEKIEKDRPVKARTFTRARVRKAANGV